MSRAPRCWLLLVCLPLGLHPAVAPAADQVDALWADLASPDAARAYQAILGLIAEPHKSVPLLGSRLRPVQPPEPAWVARLVQDLQSQRFPVRARATQELERLGELAEAELRKALDEKAPLEQRRRVEQLLGKLEGPVTQTELLRQLRAVEVLEHVGTGHARDVLGRLAAGAPGARLTREAKASLARLKRRPAPSPPTKIPEPGIRTDLYGDPLPAGAVARLGTVRLRHSSYFATAMVVTPDGKTVLSAAPSGTALCYWRTADGKVLRKIQDTEPVFGSLSLAADGKVLASAGSVRVGPQEFQGRVGLWDVASGRLLHALVYPVAATPSSMALCPDGKTVITADSDGVLRVWDVPTAKNIRRLKLAKGPMFSAMALSADGSLVAAGQHSEKSIYLWAWKEADAARRIKLPPSNYASRAPSCLALSPDSKTLASAGDVGLPGVYLWDIGTGRLLRTFSTGDVVDCVHAVRFSSDGKQLASAGGDALKNAVVVWDPASGKQLRRFDIGPEMAKHLAFSADGRLLAAAAGSGVRLWRTDTGEAVAECREAHRGLTWALAFSPRGDRVATGCTDGTVRLWEAVTGKQRGEFRHDGDMLAVAISPDDWLLASSGRDEAVRLWDLATGRQIYKLAGHGPYSNRGALAFRQDGKTLVSWGDDLYLRVWDVAKGKAILEHRPHPAGAKGPDDDALLPGQEPEQALTGALSPDGRLCLLAEFDKLHVFEVTAGNKLRSVPVAAGHWPPVVSPDGKLVVVLWDVGSQEFLSILDLDSAKLLAKIFRDGGWVGALAFSPDGKMVAAIAWLPERHVELWEVSTGQKRLTIGGVSAGHALAFSPDGRLLVTGMLDTTVLVWDLARFRK